MERLFGEKSYRPNGFEIDFWGTRGGDSAEYTAFRERKIKGNILLAAYYTPVTLKEISIELGVAHPYLEDEVKLLLQREYLISKNGKYLTNIPIFTQDCTLEIENKLKELTEETAKKFAEIADSFDSRFGDRFGDENLTRWQKILLCLHFSLIDTENHLRENYEEPTADGPYVHVNSGGGKGIVWGRSTEDNEEKERPDGIQGIYNGCPSSDSRGRVIAMNFMQTLNSQDFDGGMTDPVVCTAVDCYEYLPDKWKDLLNDLGYAKNGKANFAVWTYEEYCCLKDVLSDSINLLSEMNRKTSEIAAKITADLAPSHINKTAEYVGAFVYRFNSIEKLVNVLFDTGYLKKADDKSKPAICVVKN